MISRSRTLWLLAGGFFIAIVAFVAMPSVSVAGMGLKLLGITILVSWAYKKLCITSTAASSILIIAGTILAVGMAANLWYFTTRAGATAETPVLFNNDAQRAWGQYLALNGIEYPLYNHWPYNYSIVLWIISGGATANIGDFLPINMLMTLLTIVFTGAATTRIVDDLDTPQSKRLCAWAMGLIAAVCYFLSSGVILIKDSMVCMSMAAFVLALSMLRQQKPHFGAWILLIASAALGVFVRSQLSIFMTLGLLVCGVGVPKKRYLMFVLLAVALIYTNVLCNYFQHSFYFGLISSDEAYLDSDLRMASYNSILGSYETLSLWQKIIRLPITLGIQWLLPLPWAWTRDIVFGPSQLYAHIAFPWYAIGGVILYYIFCGWRRSPRPLILLTIFGVCSTCATALATGGTISRYCLPWLPLLIPAAAWVMTTKRWKEKSFKIFYGIYVAAIIVALVCAFTIINHYSPGGWEAL